MSTVVLAKDEQQISEYRFHPNLVTFWLEGHYVLTNKRVTGSQPNLLFGLIPLGRLQVAQPLKAVASVVSSTRFYLSRLIFGLIFLFIGFPMLGQSFLLGLFLTLIGVVNVLNCYTATFVVTNNGGQKDGYSISILEREKVQQLVNEINNVIAES